MRRGKSRRVPCITVSRHALVRSASAHFKIELLYSLCLVHDVVAGITDDLGARLAGKIAVRKGEQRLRPTVVCLGKRHAKRTRREHDLIGNSIRKDARKPRCLRFYADNRQALKK